MTEKIKYSVVMPLYNEEDVINESYRRLKSVMETLGEGYEIIFVNDGSRDKTIPLAHEICAKDSTVKFIDFSRNFGHQIAITAGMDYSVGDAVVVIDADLQDPPEVIPQMIEKWKEGYEVVFGKRAQRKGETFFKKLTAKVFYRFLRSMTDVDIPVDTGDFRLIDRKVCDALKLTGEHGRFIRGMISWIGFKQIGVEYSRDKRFAGVTKYPLKKMLKLAADGIMSFSSKPLKLASNVGFWLSALSFLYLIASVIFGLAGMLLSVSLFFNGIVLVCLGIIGEYIGRIYDEAKGRPLYLVRGVLNFDENQKGRY